MAILRCVEQMYSKIQSLQKKSIGYLLENNPLYYKMYVREFLSFLAGIHSLKNKRDRVDQIIELTGLTLESKKQIGQLSKGYKQRVGIAQALIHDPEVVILDEPTSGLDPNQLSEIRKLIKSLGQEKTVIFSSHIMQEVEELCDQVIIIDKGNLVANNTLVELQTKVSERWITQVETLEPLTKDILNILGVLEINHQSENRVRIISDKDIRKDISQFCKEKDLTLLEMTTERSDLEDIFQSLTGNI